jgi:hypothetical protein
MVNLAEVEFEFIQLLLEIISGGVQEGDNFIRYQRMLDCFSAVAMLLTTAEKPEDHSPPGKYTASTYY